jgi:hypothetical protein
MKIKVKILSHLPGVYTNCQPEVGKVYEANYSPPKIQKDYGHHYAAVCVINVNGKQICLKSDEYEILEE